MRPAVVRGHHEWAPCVLEVNSCSDLYSVTDAADGRWLMVVAAVAFPRSGSSLDSIAQFVCANAATRALVQGIRFASRHSTNTTD